MNLGSPFSGLDLGDLGDYAGKAEREARRKKRKTKRSERTTARKDRRSVRQDARQERKGMSLAEKRADRKSTRKKIRQVRKIQRQQIRAGGKVISASSTRPGKKHGVVGRGPKRCAPGTTKMVRGAQGPIKLRCVKGKWAPVPQKKPGHRPAMPRTSEEAMALAVEASYQAEQYATPEEAYEVEQMSAGGPEFQPSSADYWDGGSSGGGGGGGGSMEPYSAEAATGYEDEADYEDDEDEEAEGSNTMLYAGVGAVLLGVIGFAVWKKNQGDEDLEDLEADDLT